jgi:uncharacterized membrane protein (UPF0136 family)
MVSLGTLLYLQALFLLFLISVGPNELIGYYKIERQVQHLNLAYFGIAFTIHKGLIKEKNHYLLVSQVSSRLLVIQITQMVGNIYLMHVFLKFQLPQGG